MPGDCVLPEAQYAAPAATCLIPVHCPSGNWYHYPPPISFATDRLKRYVDLMRYRLRTLLIVLAIAPACLYVLWLLLQLAAAIGAIVEPHPRQH